MSQSGADVGSPCAARSGLTALEMIVALTLASFLVGALTWFVARSARNLARTVERSQTMHTLGISRHVVGTELRAGVETDWSYRSSAITLRVFRATGLFCPGEGAPEARVVWVRGDRRPDPAKDSVLVLSSSGTWRAVALSARSTSSDPCPAAPERPTEKWTFSEPVPDAVLGRVYEHGTYSFDGDALRYSRGRGGRQPLTPPMLAPGSAAGDLHAGGVELTLTTPSTPLQPLGSTRTFLFRARPHP